MYLEVPKEAGGLGLPNFIFYYWAANVVKLLHWIFTYENQQGIDWAQLELLSNPLPLLTSPLPYNSNTQITNLVIKASLKIWLQLRKHFGLTQASWVFPVANNQFFPSSGLDNAFQHWHNNGLVFFCDLFTDSTFSSFQTITEDHNIPGYHFFRYLQIRSLSKK